MKFFVAPTIAPKPRTKESGRVALFYAGILLVFALAQLFTFDKFLVFLYDLNSPLLPQIATALPAVIVAAEVFALPFLLRMNVSPAFRFVSMGCSWLVAALWLFVSLWLVRYGTLDSSLSFLGSLVKLTPGYWAVALTLALSILAVWASWGLWPGKRKKVVEK